MKRPGFIAFLAVNGVALLLYFAGRFLADDRSHESGSAFVSAVWVTFVFSAWFFPKARQWWRDRQWYAARAKRTQQ